MSLARSQGPRQKPRNTPQDFHCQRTEAELRLLRALILDQANMSEETKESPVTSDLLKNSSLYREFQAEREEILKHKWIESEKVGHDIGFEQALTDWILRHRSKWRKARQGTCH